MEWLQLFGHYRKGILPFTGGILEQPASYKDAMETIGSEVNTDTDELE